jgi:hypothetical protein
MEDRPNAALPRGAEYSDLISRLEGECDATTAAYLLQAGEKAPKTWTWLGTNLAALDGLSSCWWGCHGGDHVVEYLLGRVVGSVRATLRLARGGLYDESFNALRTAGEIVNLLTLFQIDSSVLVEWRAASPAQRFALARPSKVMTRLAAEGRQASSLDLAKYDLMSRIAHGNTSDAPQSHNAIGLPLTSGVFQEAGFLVAMNEAALSASLAILAGVNLIDLAPQLARGLLHDARELVSVTGSITLTTVNEALTAQREAIVEHLSQARADSQAREDSD